MFCWELEWEALLFVNVDVDEEVLQVQLSIQFHHSSNFGPIDYHYEDTPSDT
jgi:hypothetical protein